MQVRPLWSQLTLLRLGALALLLLVAYRALLEELIRGWWTDDAHSHGLLVLPISLFIVWTKRGEIERLRIEPAGRLGLLIMSVAGVLLMVGQIGGVLVLAEVSLVMMLSGVVLTLLGTAYLKAFWFPLAYLVFMFPVLDAAVLAFSWQFQLLTARMGVAILQLLSIPAHLDQNHIGLPNVTLRVAVSCSGTRYLISILAMAVPLAYVTLKRLPSRIVLVILSVAIGIVANWIRVVFIGLWAYFGGEVVHGPFHMFQAFSVAWLAFAGLLLCAWGLSRAEGPATSAPLPVAATGKGPTAPPGWNRSFGKAMLLLALVIIYPLAYFSAPVPLKQSFAAFPANIGSWAQATGSAEAPLLRIQGADGELHRTYLSPAGRRVHLYVAYFEFQEQGKEAVSHLMAPLRKRAQPLCLDGPGDVIINRSFLLSGESEDQNYEVLYWYDLNGRILVNELWAKAVTVWEGLTRGSTNGAVVLVSHQVQSKGSLESDSSDAVGFVAELLPVLRQYLP